MTLKLKVPSMVCDGCVSVIKNAIAEVAPTAKVNIDLDSKQVTVETTAARKSIEQTIIAAGHTVAS